MARLMAIPALNAHKPDPIPPSPEQIASLHARDLDHWSQQGFGRYIVHADAAPVGLCGLSLRDGFSGLNLSYHLSPDQWGNGYATTLVAALINLADAHLHMHGPVFALARPTNPASNRVLQKCGFIEAETLSLGGAPTVRYVRRQDTVTDIKYPKF